ALAPPQRLRVGVVRADHGRRGRERAASPDRVPRRQPPHRRGRPAQRLEGVAIVAEIRIDPARRIGTVDRRIFGGFAEHLGRCIYGGVFDEGSPLADERGFRRDVLEAARALRMPLLRWPGGNFVSGYHWADGVGPRDGRPRRTELAWFSEEPNRFGTDEFMQYCRALGTEPYVC